MPGLFDDLDPAKTTGGAGLFDDLDPAPPVRPEDQWVPTEQVSFLERPITAIGQGIGRLMSDPPTRMNVSPDAVDKYAQTHGMDRRVAAELMRAIGYEPDSGSTIVNEAQVAALPTPTNDPEVLAELHAAAMQRERDTPERTLEAQRLQQVPESMRWAAAGLRRVPDTLLQSALYAGSVLGGGDDTRAALEMVGQPAAARAAASSDVLGRLGQAGAGAVENLTSMILTPGGAGPKIAQAMSSEGGRSYVAADDAGLSEEDARNFAGKQAIAEGVPAALFQALGIGGVERVVAGGGRDAARALTSQMRGAIRDRIRETLRASGVAVRSTLAEEIPEELITTVWQQKNEADDIDPQAMDNEQMADAMAQTVLQTVLMGGMANAPGVTRGVVRDVTRPGVEAQQRRAAEQQGALAAMDPTQAQQRQVQDGVTIPSESASPEVVAAAERGPDLAGMAPEDVLAALREMAMGPQGQDVVGSQQELEAIEQELAQAAIDPQAVSPTQLRRDPPPQRADQIEAAEVERLQAESEAATRERAQALLQELEQAKGASQIAKRTEAEQREAYLVREDLAAFERAQETGEAPVGHRYDDRGRIIADETQRNRVYDLGEAQARAQAAQAEQPGDTLDPTLTKAAREARFAQKGTPAEDAARDPSIRRSAPEPAMDDAAIAQAAERIVALPQNRRAEVLRSFPSEDRRRIAVAVRERRTAERGTAPEARQAALDRLAQVEAEESGAPATPSSPSPLQGQRQSVGAGDRGTEAGALPVQGGPATPSIDAGAASAPATKQRPGPAVPEMRSVPVMGQIGAAKTITSEPTPEHEAQANALKDAMPTFMGGKAKMGPQALATIDRTMGADAQRITEVHDLFGGGGSWGLFLTLARFPNAKSLVVREFNPERLERIRFFQEQGDRFLEVARSSGAQAIAEREFKEVVSGGGIAGHLRRILAGPEVSDPQARLILQAIVDYGSASFGRRGINNMIGLIADQAAAAKRAHDAFTARGGVVRYESGSSYDATIPSGPQVFAVADPPYYGTTKYNEGEGAGSTVDLGIYEQTASLMERLSRQGNSLLYTDEAWWAKHTKKGEPNAPSDWQAGMRPLARIFDALDYFDVADKTIAGRHETLGVINGFRRTNRQPAPAGADVNAGDPAAQGPSARSAVPADDGRRRDPERAAPEPVATGVTREDRAPAAAGPGPGQPAASVAAPAPAAAAPVRNDLLRGLGPMIERAVPGATVAATADALTVTLPGGIAVRVGELQMSPEQVNPDAWFRSITAHGNLDGMVEAFSRANVPLPAGIDKASDRGDVQGAAQRWHTLKKADQQAVIAQAMPLAALSVDGVAMPGGPQALIRFRDALVRPASEVQTDVLEEFYQFAWRLLSPTERALVSRAVRTTRPDLAKQVDESVAVEEAAAQWLIGYRDRRQAELRKRTGGVVKRLLQRIAQILKLDALVRRKAGPPTIESVADAVVSGDVFRQAAARDPGRKAASEAFSTPRTLSPAARSFVEGLPEQDREALRDDLAHLERHPDPQGDLGNLRMLVQMRRSRPRAEVPAYATLRGGGIQAFRDQVAPPERQTFEEWNEQAREILRDAPRLQRLADQVEAGEAVSAAEQRALRFAAVEALDRANRTGSKADWSSAVGWAFLEDAAGTEPARAMAARRFDLSTPEGRREMLVSFAMRPGQRWQRQAKAAKTKKEKRQVQDRWQKHAERIMATVKADYGVDLTDPRLGEIFDDAFAVQRLAAKIANARPDWDLADLISTHWILGLLSWPVTWGKNILGNGGNLLWKAGMERPLMALMGSVTPGEGGARLGELPHFYKGLMVGFGRAFRNAGQSYAAEHDVLEEAVLGERVQRHQEANRAKAPTIPGLRELSSKPIAMVDGFFKAWFAHAAVGAIAYRTAKEQGLKGGDLSAFIADAFNNPGASPVWAEAMLDARTLTFQSLMDTPEGMTESGMVKAMRAVQGLARWKLRTPTGYGLIQPGIFVLPFIGTPTDIIRQSVRKIAPIQAVNMLAKAVIKGRDYTKSEVLRDAAELVFGTITAAVLAGLVGDQDEEDPWITGEPADWKSGQGLAERERRAPQPYSFKTPWGRWSYQWIEPFRGSVAPVVSWLQGRKGEAIQGVFGNSFMEQLMDFGGAIAEVPSAFLKDGEEQERETRRLRRFGTSLVAGFVPRAIRQSIREGQAAEDEWSVRPSMSSRPQPGESSGGLFVRNVLQLTGAADRPPVTRDIYGREVRQGPQTWTDVGFGYLGLDRRDDQATPYDHMIIRWNAKVANEGLVDEKGKSLEYWPDRYRWTFSAGGKQHAMTEAQYDAFVREAGSALLSSLQRTRLNVENPTAADIARFKALKTQAQGRAMQRLLPLWRKSAKGR